MNVLAAGRGSRPGSPADDQPKTLVEAGDRHPIEPVLGSPLDLDVRGFIVVAGSPSEQIIDRYAAVHLVAWLTSVLRPALPGLAHATRRAGPSVDDHFVSMLGDDVFDADLEAAIGQLRAGSAGAMVSVDRVPVQEAWR